MVNENRSDFEQELMKIDSLKSKHGAGGVTIPMKEFQDHKLVTLWTSLNKKIGPMTVMNAENTMRRWMKKGIELYLDKRTDAQIDAYKQTDKYKKLHKVWKDQRIARHKQSKKKDIIEMAQTIADATGKVVADELGKTKKSRGKRGSAKGVE